MLRTGNIIILLLVMAPLLSAQDAKRTAKPEVNWGSLDGGLSDTGLPDYWSTSSVERGFECDTNIRIFRSAPRSLQLRSTIPWANAIAGQHPVAKGTRQSARAFVKVAPDSAGDVAMLFQYLDNNGKAVGASKAVVVGPQEATLDGPWMLLAIEGRADDFPTAVKFQLLLANRRGATSYWDDVDARSYPDPVPGELFFNSDFELIQGKTFPGWSVETSEPDKATLKPVLDNTKRGMYSAHMTGEGPKTTLKSSRIAIQPGKTYRLTGWHRATNGTGTFRLAFWKGSLLVTQQLSQEPASKEWSACKELVVLPAAYSNATEATIEYEATGKFDITLDALQLTSE